MAASSATLSRPVLTLALARASEAATIAIARHDERLARAEAALSEGALRRADLADAQALIALRGGRAPLEDIVLNDAAMDVRTPTSDVVRAVSLLQLRRSLARRAPEAALDPAFVRDLAGVAEPAVEPVVPIHRPPEQQWSTEDDREFDDGYDEDVEPLDPLTDEPISEVAAARPSLQAALSAADALLARNRRPLASYNHPSPDGGAVVERIRDPDYDGEGRLAAWLEALADAEALPAALAAAVALDRWLWLEPSEHRGEAGFLLAAALLRRRGASAGHLPALARGYRSGRYRWSPHQDEDARLGGLLAAIGLSARLGGGDLDRLSLASEVMGRRCQGRSKNSRLPALVGLFIASPLVTVQMAAKRLSVTPQAVEAMLKELGASLPRELTGRKRYRAWGVI
jgi:hypothetical protein